MFVHLVITLPSIYELFGLEGSTIASELQSQVTSRAIAAVAAGVEVNCAGAQKMFSTITNLITESKMPIAEFVGESYTSVFTSIFVSPPSNRKDPS